MDKNIGVGAIVGLVTASSLYVWNSESFTKNQKIFLLCCVFFFPLQWIGILVILAYNNYKINNTEEKITERKTYEVKSQLNSSISNLTDLKDKGILTDEEYKEKVGKIESEKTEQDLKNSTEYKQLKSLYNSDVLTKDEFEDKIEILKNKYFEDKKESNNSSNSIIHKANYDKKIELVKGNILTIHNSNKQDNPIGLKVSINNQNINDDFYRSKKFIYEVRNSTIIDFYSIKDVIIDNCLYVSYCRFGNLTIGDFIFYNNNAPLEDGKYKLDVFKRLSLKNGRIEKITDYQIYFLGIIIILIHIIILAIALINNN